MCVTFTFKATSYKSCEIQCYRMISSIVGVSGGENGAMGDRPPPSRRIALNEAETRPKRDVLLVASVGVCGLLK